MRYQQDLQVALRDRLRRLVGVTSGAYPTELRYAMQWITAQAPLKALIADAVSKPCSITVDEWVSLCESARGLTVPRDVSEAGRAALTWQLIQRWTEDGDAAWRFGHLLISDNNLNAMTQAATDHVVVPLFDYLTERLGSDSNVLYVLERCRTRIEWFDQALLYAEFQANTQRGEEVYDEYIRRFVFDQGYDMPIAQAKSPSGLSDVLIDLDMDDALVCEVKIFDDDNRRTRAIVSAVTQATQYARDHSRHSAYVVIINLSGRPLKFPSDGPDGALPYLVVGNIVVHLFDVRALPSMKSASKQGKVKPLILDREDLVGEGRHDDEAGANDSESDAPEHGEN